MNTINDLANQWWENLSWTDKCNLMQGDFIYRHPQSLTNSEIESLFYSEVMLKWYESTYNTSLFQYLPEEIKEAYLKEHSEPKCDGDGKLIIGQQEYEWISCVGYSAQEYPDFKKGWGVRLFNGTKGTVEAYHNPYLYIEGQVDEIHKMNIKAYITFEQPQSVLKTIDVEEIISSKNIYKPVAISLLKTFIEHYNKYHYEAILMSDIDDFVSQHITSVLKHIDVEEEFVSGSCAGEKCSVCGKDAYGKVGEEIAFDDPLPNRHNLTAYVCKQHFDLILRNNDCKGDVDVRDKAKPQIEHFFKKFTRLANEFFNDNDMVLFNYWKGQVMGMSKVVNQLGLDINTDYWLKQIP